LDTFELNKIAGGILLCLLVVMGLKNVGEIVFEVPEPATPGYDVSSLAVEEAPAAGENAQKPEDFMAALAMADPDKGSRVFRRCTSCHTIEKGGDNKIGPNLFDVVGNHFQHKDDFAYSDAFKAAAPGKTWTYDELDKWLTNPKAFIPGTKMSFAGLTDVQQRADVIAYLAQESPDNAPPLPKPAPAEAAPAADQAPAEGTPAPAGDVAPAQQAPATGEQAPAPAK